MNLIGHVVEFAPKIPVRILLSEVENSLKNSALVYIYAPQILEDEDSCCKI
jgi:hypothetical protein